MTSLALVTASYFDCMIFRVSIEMPVFLLISISLDSSLTGEGLLCIVGSIECSAYLLGAILRGSTRAFSLDLLRKSLTLSLLTPPLT